MINEKIQYFEKALESYKNKHILKKEYVVLGVKFSESNKIDSESNGELMLKHTVIHACYSKYSDKMPRSEAKKFHKIILEEFKKRNIEHRTFDKLDG